MTIVLQLLFAEPLITLVVLCTLLVLAYAVSLWRRSTLRRLRQTIVDTAANWKTALAKPEEDFYKRVLENSSVLSHRVEEFDGASRSEYKEARKVWSSWLMQRQKMEELLGEAETCRIKFKDGAWWQLSLGPLRKAAHSLTRGQVEINTFYLKELRFTALANAAEPREVELSELPAQYLEYVLLAQSLFERFSKAFETAQKNVFALKQAIGEDNVSIPGSLFLAKRKLTDLRLPITPYLHRLDFVVSEAETLGKLIQRQPLSDHSGALIELHALVESLNSDLSYACKIRGDMLSARMQLQEVEERITGLRAAQVPSGLPGVQVYGAWRLDEEGFNPDPYVTESKRLLAELSDALIAGRLATLDGIRLSVTDATANASRLVDKALEEKALIERQLAEITASSTAADLDADQLIREESVQGYVAQRWGQVRKQTAALVELHTKRLTARLESKKLLDMVVLIGGEIKAHPDVVSVECEKAYALLVRQAQILDAESKKGRADWDVLQSTIISVRTARVEDGVASVQDLLNAELAAWQEARVFVQGLREELLELESRIADNWGGEEARNSLASTKPVVEEVLVSADIARQDWAQLLKRAQSAHSRLSRALTLVETEVNYDRAQHEKLTALGAELETCRLLAYVRTICSVSYGLGVYCPLEETRKNFVRAEEQYKQRRYEEMEALLREGREALIKGHLDAWWMCLEALSMSSDPCAQQFAADQGYSEWGFEAWMEKCTILCRDGALYNLPDIACNRHNPGAFAAAVVGDAPDVQDYAPSGLGRS